MVNSTNGGIKFKAVKSVGTHIFNPRQVTPLIVSIARNERGDIREIRGKHRRPRQNADKTPALLLGPGL